jgi:hypothetical protein
MMGSFRALKSFADFDQTIPVDDSPEEDTENDPPTTDTHMSPLSTPVHTGTGRINLGYTINLNLPATSEVAVFDAIFTSLRQHLIG